FEDVQERRLYPKIAVECLEQIDDDEQCRSDRETQARERRELAHKIAVENMRRAGGFTRVRDSPALRYCSLDRTHDAPHWSKSRRLPFPHGRHKKHNADTEKHEIRCPDGGPCRHSEAEGDTFKRGHHDVVAHQYAETGGKRDRAAAAVRSYRERER